MDLVRDGVGSFRLNHRDMKDQMDCIHAVWKPENVGPGASWGNDFKGANILLSEFLQRDICVEELGQKLLT